MPDPIVAELTEQTLRTIDLEAAAVTEVEVATASASDAWVRRYLAAFPPRTALQLVERARELRAGLRGAVEALEGEGYTHAAWEVLTPEEREAPVWRAVRRSWELMAETPAAVLRFSRGGESLTRAFPTPEAALHAAIDTLEMCDGYPEAIESESGEQLMDTAAILRAWEDRHDPG